MWWENDFVKTRKRSLYLGGEPAERIARRHGTPLMVYSGCQIRAHYRALRHVFTRALRLPLRVCYAMKANPHLEILKLLEKQWMGMDVHDVGDYKVDGEWRLLEPGMVLTIEPGLYVPPAMEGVRDCYWRTGIRIEDDLLVTATAHEVLTEGVPKSVAEIEAWMAG